MWGLRFEAFLIDHDDQLEVTTSLKLLQENVSQSEVIKKATSWLISRFRYRAAPRYVAVLLCSGFYTAFVLCNGFYTALPLSNGFHTIFVLTNAFYAVLGAQQRLPLILCAQ